MNRYLRIALLATAAGFAALLTGCATPMGAPQPTIDNTARLRGAPLQKAGLGTFAVDSSKPASLDQSVSMRGSSLHSPVNGSFAQYLKETLRAELDAAGLYDATSPAVITGTLIDTDVDAAIGTGTARLSARFVVTRNGATAFDKVLTANSSWESSFMGAVAIPLAASKYQELYRKLAGQLFEDPAFRKALAK